MQAPTMTNEVIWVTGASSGIGRAVAQQLAAQGNQVLVSARNVDALDELRVGHHNIIPYPCDVTDRTSVGRAANLIAERHGAVDRVIINAGTCEYFDVTKPDWGMMERVMAVNFFGAVNTVAAALPLLRQSHGARRQIVAVASLASVVPFPRSEAYGASKAAVDYFFQSLGVDLHKENIAVTVVQPGFVATPLTERNDFPMPFLMKVEDAAAIICTRMVNCPRRITFPRRLAMPLYWLRSLPRLWHWLAVNKLSREQEGA